MWEQPAYLYCGQVVHKRLRPCRHALAYNVFSFLIDVDRIDEAVATSPLFSRNRFNLFSLFDRDFGPGDGTPAAQHARDALAKSGISPQGLSIQLLAYPRVLGYVFNPLSVYFCFESDGKLRALIYEVSNTFGERKSYVVNAGKPHGNFLAQSCKKELFVSPFASSHGRYSFRVQIPDRDLLVAVLLRDQDGALLKTHFRATRKPLTALTLLGILVRYPLMTLKVIAGIHWEAIRLWFRGVPVISGHRSPRYSVSGP